MASQQQKNVTTTFHKASFQTKIGKISLIPQKEKIMYPKYVFLNSCEFNLMVLRKTEIDYDVSVRLDCPLGYTIHCQVIFIDRRGKEQLAEGEKWHIFGTVSTIVIKRLNIEKEGTDLLSEDCLIIRCKLFVDEDWNTVGVAAPKKADSFEDSEVSEDLSALVLNGTGTDVKIYVKKTPFTVHKAILRSRSTVFRDMLRHDMMECNGVVEINDIEPESFHDYLDHLYTRKIPDISGANVCDLYLIANRFNAQELKTASMKFMLNDFSVSNFCDYTIMAEQHNDTMLFQSAKKFFGKNMKDIIATNKWMSLTDKESSLATELLIFGCSQMSS